MIIKYFFFVIFMASTLGAHEFWIGGDGVLQRGHPNANAEEHAHESGEVQKYPSEIYCRRGGEMAGRELDFAVSERVDTACDSVMVVMHLGLFAKTPYGIVQAGEANASMVINSWESIESVKRLNRLSDFAPMGRGFELSFSRDPSALETGDKMRILATYDGAPKNGVTVAYDGRVVGTTDSEGHINVRVRHPGLQVIRATYRQPLDNAPVRERLYNATLNLEVQ